jgi:PAS domain S-box-containing protein
MGDEAADLRERLEAENRALRAQLDDLRGRKLSARELLLVAAERVAHLGSWGWDLGTGTIQWSDELYRILGYDPAVVPTSEGFFAAIHEEDRARVQATAAHSLEHGTQETVEFRVLRPDGEVRHVRMEGEPLFDEQHRQVYVVGTVLDLTDSIRAAALLARTVDELRDAQRAARMGSFRWEVPGRRVEWSLGLYELVGLDPRTPVNEELWRQHVHPEDRERMEREAAQIFATGVVQPGELRLVRRDGTVLHVAIDARACYDDAGRLCELRGFVQDISRRKALEEQLRHSQKMEAVGTLAGGVAHDFNNYLQVMTCEASTLRARLERGHPALASVEAIQAAADRCTALTSQLLTLSRRRPADRRNVDLGDLVQRLAPMLRTVLGPGVDLALRIEEGPAVVFVDPAQVEHALLNLVVNARDAMAGRGRLTVTLERVVVDSGGWAGNARRAFIRLAVNDTGAGIAPEHLGRIFEPFFTTKGVGKGTGLGLTTVYGLVDQAGGHVDVESTLGRGATFSIYLPPSASAALPARVDPAPARVVAARGQTVLLVEDVDEVREVLRQLLASAGYRVLTAPNGKAALERLAAGERVDVVLTDLVMPVLGGLELERQLGARHPGVRCLLMTGYADAVAEEQPRARRLLRKPFTKSELLAALAEVLGPAEAAGAAGPTPAASTPSG